MITENAQPIDMIKPKILDRLSWPKGWARTPEKSRYSLKTPADPVVNADQLIKALQSFGAQKIVVSYSPRAGKGEPGASVRFEKAKIACVLAQDGCEKPEGNLAALTRTIQSLKRMEDSGDIVFVIHVLQSLSESEAVPSKLIGQSTDTHFETVEADVVDIKQNTLKQKPWWEVLDVSHTAGVQEIETAYIFKRQQAVASKNSSLLYTLEEAYAKATSAL